MTVNEKINKIVASIPVGKVTTYGDIAKAIGMRSSARYVGWVLNSGKGDMKVPAHRVVNRNGELTGRMHFPTPTFMRDLLEAEGVAFVGDSVDMKTHRWIPKELD